MPPGSADTGFLDQLKETIEQYSMLTAGDRVLTAVSGGPDSVALLYLLHHLKPIYSIDIAVAHFNHQLRGADAHRDQAFTSQLAKTLGLLFFSDQADVRAHAAECRLSIETAGRNLRYRFLEGIAKTNGYNRIATGHHQDDNAEQVLMNLIRGSGPEGLCGIPPVRDGWIIRPMLGLSKQQIRDFLKKENIAFMMDDTNSDPAYLRNRIRHQLIPELKAGYNPSVTIALDRLSTILRTEETFWDRQIQTALNYCTIAYKDKEITLGQDKINAQEKGLKRRVLRRAIDRVKGSLQGISHSHIRSADHFISQAENGKSLDLPGRIRIYKNRGTILIKEEARALRDIGREHKKELRARQARRGQKG